MSFYIRKLNTFLSAVATYNADFLLQAWHAERELPAPQYGPLNVPRALHVLPDGHVGRHVPVYGGPGQRHVPGLAGRTGLFPRAGLPTVPWRWGPRGARPHGF